jgi:hypothetical protein
VTRRSLRTAFQASELEGLRALEDWLAREIEGGKNLSMARAPLVRELRETARRRAELEARMPEEDSIVDVLSERRRGRSGGSEGRGAAVGGGAE